ncbi:hypothetical protein HDE78_003347 [Rhodanobacter sp. K2T2]|nr:hypothetical protein [Rhodanobacter sp. K2T2]NYE30378.1 hypothetical protein [Rhodanobacter sp. K2T2]
MPKATASCQPIVPDADGLIHLEMRLANTDGIRQIGGVVAKADAASAP